MSLLLVIITVVLVIIGTYQCCLHQLSADLPASSEEKLKKTEALGLFEGCERGRDFTCPAAL